MNKRGYEFSFAWIFAIFVGAIVIFFAIYATTKVIDTQRTTIDTVSAKRIGILLTPVETNLESSRLAKISVSQETRLITECETQGNFGVQKISSLVKSGIGDDWQPEAGVQSSFRNKYIFAQTETHSEEEFYIFTKPFKFPYKVADLTIIWSDKKPYCFVFSSETGEQNQLKEELEILNPENIELVSEISSCSSTSRKVCFEDASSCDVLVSLSTNKIKYEDGKTYDFVESLDNENKFSLLFAAIFSDSQTYECQTQRLAKRAANLADLYRLKSNFLSEKGCSSSPLLPAALQTLKNSLSSSDLGRAESAALDLRTKNGNLGCKLF